MLQNTNLIKVKDSVISYLVIITISFLPLSCDFVKFNHNESLNDTDSLVAYCFINREQKIKLDSILKANKCKSIYDSLGKAFFSLISKRPCIQYTNVITGETFDDTIYEKQVVLGIFDDRPILKTGDTIFMGLVTYVKNDCFCNYLAEYNYWTVRASEMVGYISSEDSMFLYNSLETQKFSVSEHNTIVGKDNISKNYIYCK